MKLDELKLKRLCEAKRLKGRVTRTTASLVRTTKRLSTDAKGRQIYASQSTADGSNTKEDDDDDEAPIQEGKKHDTPEFVRHCVTAITEKPKDLERVEKGAPEGSDGSPFAICWAKYKGNKRGLAAKHAKGEHHTDSQYEKALTTLREEVERARRENAERSPDTYSDVDVTPTANSRHLIRYVPRG